MGQVLHGSASTTEAIRRSIKRNEESVRALAKRHGISPTTVQKWRKRSFVADLPMGPIEVGSTILSVEEEAMIVAFRRHTLLPLDDCLYALQSTIPNLSRSSLHRCLQRHGISRLPEIEDDKPAKQKFKVYPIGYFHIDIAEVRTKEGKLYLFVAIDRTSKLAFVRTNRTLKGAIVKRYPCDSHDQLRQDLGLFIDTYDYARRLKALHVLTACEYIAKMWTKEPSSFKLDPYRFSSGLNTQRSCRP